LDDELGDDRPVVGRHDAVGVARLDDLDFAERQVLLSPRIKDLVDA